MTAEEVRTFERCIAVGGLALFPADTVYGLATEPDSREGVERLYRLKGRKPDRPAAVMFFRLELALAAVPELGERTRGALERLLPGRLVLEDASDLRIDLGDRPGEVVGRQVAHRGGRYQRAQRRAATSAAGTAPSRTIECSPSSS